MHSDHAIIDIGMGLSRLTHEGVPTGRASEFLDNMHKRKDGISPFALRRFWSMHMVDFCPALASLAGRALCMHATSCASESSPLGDGHIPLGEIGLTCPRQKS